MNSFQLWKVGAVSGTNEVGFINWLWLLEQIFHLEAPEESDLHLHSVVYGLLLTLFPDMLIRDACQTAVTAKLQRPGLVSVALTP